MVKRFRLRNPRKIKLFGKPKITKIVNKPFDVSVGGIKPIKLIKTAAGLVVVGYGLGLGIKAFKEAMD